jgi:signal transduction histidine kinase
VRRTGRIEGIFKVIKIEYLNTLILFVALLSTGSVLIWILKYKELLSYREKATLFIIIFFIFVYFAVVYIGRFIISGAGTKTQYVFCLCRFIIDQAIVSLFVYYGGGYSSAFALGYLVVTLLSAIVLGLYGALIVATAASIFYLYVSFASGITVSYYWLDVGYRIVPIYFIAIATGLLADTFVRYAVRVSELNEELKDKSNKLSTTLEMLRKSEKELIEAERGRLATDITESVAHLIRNPITSIGGMARIIHKKLKKEKGLEDVENYIKATIEECSKLDIILKNVLELTEKEMNLVVYSINAILKQTIPVFKTRCSEKNIAIVTHFDEENPEVLMDKKKISIAIDNIIENAISAMPGGGKLTISTRKAEFMGKKMVNISISDTGKGIPPPVLKDVFKPFIVTEAEKAGLGLPITKHIIEMHKGSINIKSTVRKGTTVDVCLPLYLPETSLKSFRNSAKFFTFSD